MAGLSFQLCVIVFLAGLLLPASCLNNDVGERPALFLFGDAVFDTGNNNQLNVTITNKANYDPYGEGFFKAPTGRACDGRLITDFIAEYAELPFIPPYLLPGYDLYIYGSSFASSGAGVLDTSNAGQAISVNSQLILFKDMVRKLRSQLGYRKARQLLSNAVYLFTNANTDYVSPVLKNSTIIQTYTPRVYVNMVIGNFTAVIQEIYNLGGRKFGFPMLGHLGCLPCARALNAGECNEYVNTLAVQHNRLFSRRLQQLQRRLNGFMYSHFNYYDVMTDMSENPSKYGFKETTVACCGSGVVNGQASCGGRGKITEYEKCDNPNEYFFYDFAHSTESANQHFANLWWHGSFQLTGGSYNLKSLFNINNLESFSDGGSVFSE